MARHDAGARDRLRSWSPWRERIVALGLCGLVVTGCAAQPDQAGAPPLTDTSGQEATAFPHGTWTGTCENKIRRVMDVAEDGTWTMVVNGMDSSSGTYRVAGDTFIFETDRACAAEGHERGVYTWALEGGRLTFTKVDDDCAWRPLTVQAVVWSPVD